MSFQTNVDPFDLWTLVHIGVTLFLGIVVGVMSRDNPKLSRKMVLGYFVFQVGVFILGLLIVAWEIVENHDVFAMLGNVNESQANYMADIFVGIVFMLIGYAIGRMKRWRR